jgi:Helix-turn-helix domain/Meiotically up-regulated gene 113
MRMTSRIRTADAAAMLGIAPRTVQSLVARGMLPGAAKIGGTWTFDRIKISRLAKKVRESGLTAGEFCEKWAREVAAELNPLPPKLDPNRSGPMERVYVVGYGPYIKIGFSGSEKGSRIRSLQTGTPEKLEHFAHLAGGRKLEKALHKKFKPYRLRGEWFKKRGALLRWLAAGCPIPKGMEQL